MCCGNGEWRLGLEELMARICRAYHAQSCQAGYWGNRCKLWMRFCRSRHMVNYEHVCDDKEYYIRWNGILRSIQSLTANCSLTDSYRLSQETWAARWNLLVDNNFCCHHEESCNPTTHSLVTAGACSFNKGRQDLPTRKQPRMSPATHPSCKQPLSTRCTTPALSTATSPRRQWREWPGLGETQPCQSCPSRSMMSSIYQTTRECPDCCCTC